MKISVIIPTLNEEKNIEKLLLHLKENTGTKEVEFLVCDGGSSDKNV
jgi:glycosyltransferase involved in cell wall biosynthesis